MGMKSQHKGGNQTRRREERNRGAAIGQKACHGCWKMKAGSEGQHSELQEKERTKFTLRRDRQRKKEEKRTRITEED